MKFASLVDWICALAAMTPLSIEWVTILHLYGLEKTTITRG